MPFEQAIRRAGDLYGIRGVLDEEAFRRFYRDGRITDNDLDRALAHRFPNLANGEELRLGERVVSPLEFLRADLLHGTPQAGRGIGTSTLQAELQPGLGLPGVGHRRRVTADFDGGRGGVPLQSTHFADPLAREAAAPLQA
jgi:hypothetical protein